MKAKPVVVEAFGDVEAANAEGGAVADEGGALGATRGDVDTVGLGVTVADAQAVSKSVAVVMSRTTLWRACDGDKGQLRQARYVAIMTRPRLEADHLMVRPGTLASNE